jgi:hypothetical protein
MKRAIGQQPENFRAGGHAEIVTRLLPIISVIGDQPRLLMRNSVRAKSKKQKYKNDSRVLFCWVISFGPIYRADYAARNRSNT